MLGSPGSRRIRAVQARRGEAGGCQQGVRPRRRVLFSADSPSRVAWAWAVHRRCAPAKRRRSSR